MSSNSASHLCKQGAGLLEKGDHSGALACFDQALVVASSPHERGPLLYNKALCMYHMNDGTASIALLEQAIKTDYSLRKTILKADEFPSLVQYPAFLALRNKFPDAPLLWRVTRLLRAPAWIFLILGVLAFIATLFETRRGYNSGIGDLVYETVGFYVESWIAELCFYSFMIVAGAFVLVVVRRIDMHMKRMR